MKTLTIVLLMFSLQATMCLSIRDLEELIKKCSVPKKFEGKFKASVKVGPHQVQMATGTGKIHADDTIGKCANFEKIVMYGKTTEMNTYISNNTTYIAKPKMKTCQKSPGIPILPGQVPPGVTLHIKRGVLHGVRVQIWEFNLKPGMGDGSETLYLTENKCLPLKVEMKLMVSGERVYAVQDYYDMKEGIKDASVFNLPKYCVKRSYYGNSERFARSPSLNIQQALAKHGMRRWMWA